jgi:hypothetical protein
LIKLYLKTQLSISDRPFENVPVRVTKSFKTGGECPMNYEFDGCTEVLLNQIIESSPEGCPEAESLLEQLSEFQKVCIGTGLCPKGELIRGYMCRHFLRDAVQRMIKPEFPRIS